MKWIIKGILILLLCFGFVGCKESNNEYKEQIERSEKISEESKKYADEQRKLNEEAQKKINEINEW